MQVSSRRNPRPFQKTMSAISLNSVQALGSIALPHSIRPNGVALSDLPENGEITSSEQFYNGQRPQWQRALSGRKVDWESLQRALVGLFQRQQPILGVGELSKLHETIRKLQSSSAGPFIYEYYKQQILTKGMIIVREQIRQAQGKSLLKRLEEAWENLFVNVLPLLEAVLFLSRREEVSLFDKLHSLLLET
ncbi:proline-rich protein 5-like [Limulus polyphemus]|uniref:Proline-rich protein 5-like n=1 Tax=Limulus polyphemus TaxID=6850 RepID=A0ABM1C3A8_LIMPO|nr:proline-rich protein 5-like [Limulus polyphemus]